MGANKTIVGPFFKNLSYLWNVNLSDWTQGFLEASFPNVNQHISIGRLTSREIITFSTLISLFNDTFNYLMTNLFYLQNCFELLLL